MSVTITCLPAKEEYLMKISKAGLSNKILKYNCYQL